MELTHVFTVPTSVDDAWALFMDLEAVGGCFPGATVTEANDEEFKGTVKVKLGPIALLYAGSGSFVERDDSAHRAVIEAKGKDKRGNGTAGATVTIQLSPDGGGTRADVRTDLAVTGKPAQFGRGVMQDVSDALLGQFVTCVEQRLGNPSVVPEATVQDGAEAAARPEIVTSAVPEQVAGPSEKLSLDEEVALSKREMAEQEETTSRVGGHSTRTAKKGTAKKSAAKKAPAKKTAANKTAAGPEASETPAAAAAMTGAAPTGTGASLPLEQLGDSEVDAGAFSITGAGPEDRAGGATATLTQTPPRPRLVSSVDDEDDALDLGSTLAPILVRRYGSFAAAGLVGLIIGWLLGRRSRSQS